MIYPLSAPLLDLLVLSVIEREDSYGYQITQQLRTVSSMKDSALYPILRRLSDNGFVDTYDRQFQGRNRKYYRITEKGRLHCGSLREEWRVYIGEIERIMSEGGNLENEKDHK